MRLTTLRASFVIYRQEVELSSQYQIYTIYQDTTVPLRYAWIRVGNDHIPRLDCEWPPYPNSAPKSMVKHEMKEAGMKYGGKVKKMASGGLASGHKSADGVTTKGKTKAKKVVMAGSSKGMKYGGKCWDEAVARLVIEGQHQFVVRHLDLRFFPQGFPVRHK